MSTTTQAAKEAAAAMGAHAPRTAYEEAQVLSLWGKIVRTSPVMWIRAKAGAAKATTLSWWRRLAGFATPVTSRISAVWRWLRTKLGAVDLALGGVYSLTTHRGRRWLLDVVPSKIYQVVKWPFRMVGRLVRKGLSRWERGERFCNAVEARIMIAEMWVAQKIVDFAGWLDDNHSTWPMRVVRNGSFMAMVVRASRLIPHKGLRAAIILFAMFARTSEIQIDGDVYSDSAVYLGADVLLRAGSPVKDADLHSSRKQRTDKAKAKAAKATSTTAPPKKAASPSDIPPRAPRADAQAAAGATNSAPGTNGAVDGAAGPSEPTGNREERRDAAKAEKLVGTGGRQRS